MKPVTPLIAALMLFVQICCGSSHIKGEEVRPHPVFAVLIDETIAGKVNAPGSTETEHVLMERLKKAGFAFVDVSFVPAGAGGNRKKLLEAASGDDAVGIRDLLSDLKADYIIIGITTTAENKISASKVDMRSLVSYSATVRLKAVNAKTGTVLAVASINRPGIALSKEAASKKAIEKALAEIIGTVNGDCGLEEGSFTRDLKQALER